MQGHSTIRSCHGVARRGVVALCFAMTLLPTTMAWHHHADVVQKRPLAMPWGQSPPPQQQPAHCTSDAYLPTTTQSSSATAAVSPHVPEDPIALSPRCTSNDAVATTTTTPISSTVQLTSSSTSPSMSCSMTPATTKTLANPRGSPTFTKAARVVRRMFSPSVQHPYNHNDAAARTMECNNACDPTCYMADASFAGFGC